MVLEELTIAEKLKILRRRVRLAQWELAHRVRIPSYRLSEFERGVGFPTGDELEQLAKALGVGLRDLQAPQRDGGRL